MEDGQDRLTNEAFMLDDDTLASFLHAGPSHPDTGASQVATA
jgi:hypothetical protein